jgi:threonine/homoserine/homoserine lactone efflux protein
LLAYSSPKPPDRQSGGFYLWQALSRWEVEIDALTKGLLLGFSIAAPVGPIGVLCIRRTLAHGRLVGFVSGLGAATADAFYGVIAGFGVAFVSSFLMSQVIWLQLVGGLFLCYLGVRTLLERPAARAANATEHGLFSAYGSTLLLTLSNPTTIISFVAVFAGLGVTAGSGYLTPAMLVLGVFLGSALWWLILSGGVSLVRGRFSVRGMRWVNVASGLIILGFGVVALGSLFLLA